MESAGDRRALVVSTRDALNRVLEALPEKRVREVLSFAESLQGKDAAAWGQFGRSQLAHAYGPDEPEYSLDDLKPELGAMPTALGRHVLAPE
jgi:hypothetical protein